MVKLNCIAAIIATFIALVSAQTPTIPSNLGNFASSIPTDLSAAAAAASSLLKNPSAIQSIISQASAQASLIPSQYQASYYSVIAEASKSASAIQAQSTTTNTKSKTGDATTSHPFTTFAICIVTIACILAAFL